MALPNVKITLANGGLGRVTPTEDAVAGMALSGVAVTDKIALGDPRQIFSLQEMDDLGITELTNALAYKEIRAFYKMFGEGAELWIMLVSNVTSLSDMCDLTNNIVKKLLDAADGRIRLLGVNRIPDIAYTPEIENGLDSDVLQAVMNLDELQKEYSAKFMPFRAVVPALGFAKANVATLHNFKQNTNPSVGVVLGADNTSTCAIGLVLGRLASIPVQRNIGRVKSGSVGLLHAYYPDGTTVKELESHADNIHDKGYIFFRKFVRRSGFYLNDDPTAAPNTDDYCSLSRGRTIDKAIVIAADTYTNELLDDVDVDPKTGLLPPSLTGYFQGVIENAIGINMTGEISGVSVYVDPKQNLLSTDKVAVRLRIIPKGQIKSIDVDLGFTNPLTS